MNSSFSFIDKNNNNILKETPTEILTLDNFNKNPLEV